VNRAERPGTRNVFELIGLIEYPTLLHTSCVEGTVAVATSRFRNETEGNSAVVAVACAGYGAEIFGVGPQLRQ
jgi:hypothetical protein